MAVAAAAKVGPTYAYKDTFFLLHSGCSSRFFSVLHRTRAQFVSFSLRLVVFCTLSVCVFVSCASPQHSISISINISSTVVACLLFIICLRRQASLFWVAFEAKNEKEEKVVVAAVVVVAMVNTIFSHAVKLIYYK